MKTALASALGLVAMAPATAAAAGLPAVGVDGRDGIVSLDGASRYVTFPSGGSTVLARLRVDGGGVARYRTIAGRLTVPAVAYDGTTDGLSRDGRTLVLIRPRVGLAQKRTRLAVVDSTRLLVRRTIVLHGDFSFDALSPDGSTAYLIQYLALRRHNFDPTRYRVRALDTRSGTLRHAPVVDPTEPREKMGGLPITRAMSPDGRWAYTLYSGSQHPFVHALDTTRETARCIDLDALTGRGDLFALKLQLAAGGRRLEIARHLKPLLLVDTQSFAVAKPHESARSAARPKAAADGGGPHVWPWVGAAVLLALVALASARPLARAARAR